jgi:hypothetical protein
MVMNVYLVLKFLSGSKGLKREGERSKTIRVPVGLARQKQMLTLKESVKLFEIICLSIRAVAELVNIDKESAGQILHEHFTMKESVLEDGAESPHSWVKGNSNERLC